MPNISQSKGSQTMKFDQLIEYNRNIFLQKLCRKCGGETIPRLFFKKSNLTTSLDLKFHTVCFLLHAKVRAIKI